MLLHIVARYFFPKGVRSNKGHPKYRWPYNVTCIGLAGVISVLLCLLFLSFADKQVATYMNSRKMKYSSITIMFCLMATLSIAQINPYTLTARQADSLHAVQAQTTNDSLKMELNAIFSIYYSENNKDSAIYFMHQQLALATKLNLPLWKGEALSYMGEQYIETGNYSEALVVLNKAIQLAVNKTSENNIYRPKLITGIPAWLTSRECLLAIIKYNIGILYTSTGDEEKAISNMAEAIRIAKKIGDNESLPLYIMDLGRMYWDENKLDSALMLEQKALALSQAAHWQYYTGYIYLTLGQLYRLKSNNTAALSNLRLCAAISHQQHNLWFEGVAHNAMAYFFLAMRQPDSAIVHSKKAWNIYFSRAKNDGETANLYDCLSSAYQMKSNKDSAYTFLLLSNQISDSIQRANQAQVQKYQVLNFKEQLRMQEAETERSRQQSRMITFITIAGLAITFLIAFLLYLNNRQKQKTNTVLAAIRDLQDRKISQLDEAVTKRTEQLNTFRQAMATDFHDQTGNMLSAITSQASLLKLKLNSYREVLPIVESIITNSNELYDSSKDFLWNLNHNSDDPLEVFNYLTGYGQVFYNQFRIPFSSSLKGEIQIGQQLEPFAALNLIYIFKEGMTNVIKHANASEVVIDMEYAAGKVIYSLRDNGKWKPKDETVDHYGLHNIERRCEKNNFGFLLSRQEDGTRIEIRVPVKIDFIS